MYWQTLFLTAKAVLETPRTVWWVKFSEDSYLNKNKKLNTLLANYKASFRFKRSHYPANSFERKTTLKTDRFKNHTIVQFWKNDFFENFREKKTDENWRKLTKTDENWRKLTKTDKNWPRCFFLCQLSDLQISADAWMVKMSVRGKECGTIESQIRSKLFLLLISNMDRLI
jgi:hypothetical protein